MEIKVPSVGESVYEATIAKWHKQGGERVEKNDLLCELETDKITLELNADADGVLSIRVPEGETVEIDAVIGAIDEGAGKKKEKEEPKEEKKEEKPSEKKEEKKAEKKEEKKEEKPAPEKEAPPAKEAEKEEKAAKVAPAAPARPAAEEAGRTRRQPMSRLRRRIAERLVAVRQQTAMLTTFSEADLTRILALRKKHGEAFEKRHGVRLGFMSFFVKACAEALKEFPEVNARIDGDLLDRYARVIDGTWPRFSYEDRDTLRVAMLTYAGRRMR
jgi:2-oxoglutarate dehydrogenase E2 component (dihydrolipoamide succinyltransferase)